MALQSLQNEIFSLCYMRKLLPLSAQKWSDWTFCVIHTAGPKRVESTSTLYHPGCGSENWYRKPMRGFNFVPIWSDSMLIFLSENQP